MKRVFLVMGLAVLFGLIAMPALGPPSMANTKNTNDYVLIYEDYNAAALEVTADDNIVDATNNLYTAINDPVGCDIYATLHDGRATLNVITNYNAIVGDNISGQRAINEKAICEYVTHASAQEVAYPLMEFSSSLELGYSPDNDPQFITATSTIYEVHVGRITDENNRHKMMPIASAPEVAYPLLEFCCDASAVFNSCSSTISTFV